jgi:periplasmic copper chaperone A
MKIAWVLVAAIVFLPACNRQSHRESGILVENWYFAAPIVAGGMTAGYGSITNESNVEIHLTGIETKCAAQTHLHNTVEDHGRISMEPITGLTVAPGQRVVFKNGGLHLMLEHLVIPPGRLCLTTFKFRDRAIAANVPISPRGD